MAKWPSPSWSGPRPFRSPSPSRRPSGNPQSASPGSVERGDRTAAAAFRPDRRAPGGRPLPPPGRGLAARAVRAGRARPAVAGRHGMKVDCIRIIEAGYAPATSEEAWLTSVLEPFEPLTRGMGVMAGIVDFGSGPPKVGRFVGRGPVPTPAPRGLDGDVLLPGPRDPGHAPGNPVADPVGGLLGHRTGSAPSRGPSRRVAGIPGGAGVQGFARHPLGGAHRPQPPRHRAVRRRRAIPPRTVGQLTRATAHLCSALRLRRADEAAGPQASGALAPDVEAVLDPSGKVHHAPWPAPMERQRATAWSGSSGAWNGPAGGFATPTPTRRSESGTPSSTGAGRWSSERRIGRTALPARPPEHAGRARPQGTHAG